MSWVTLKLSWKKLAFFLIEQSIVKDGELIYLFIHFLLFLFFCWLVDVFLVAVVIVVVVLVLVLAFLLLCCPPVSSKDFVINLQLIWRKTISVSCSNPERIVTIGTAVRLTNSNVRISIVSCIVCNVDIMVPKSWKIVIGAVRGPIIVFGYVLFEVSITSVVFQWVYEGICRILITSRPWRDKKQNTNN